MNFKEKINKLFFEEAVFHTTSKPEVGEAFDIEKYNYTNEKLNELTMFLHSKVLDLFDIENKAWLKSILPEKQMLPSSNLLGRNIIYNQVIGFNNCLSEIKRRAGLEGE